MERFSLGACTMSVLIEPLLSLEVSDSHACQAWGIVLWRAKKIVTSFKSRQQEQNENTLRFYYPEFLLMLHACGIAGVFQNWTKCNLKFAILGNGSMYYITM